MANKDLTIRLKVQNLISAGLSDAQKHLGAFAKSIGSNLMNVKAGFDMLKGAITSFAQIAVKPLQEAFRFESSTIQFKILLGNMDLAKQRMAELADFAAKTPFELNELVDASKVLHTFSQGALGGIESMKLIGDAAAAVGEPFQEVAFWIGRAYTAIKSGEPFGRAALRLQELKLLTPETRAEMEAFQASGASNIEVWEAFTKTLKTFEGGMIQLSKTGEGLTSTLKDDWTAALRALGMEFSDQAKGGIKELSSALVKLVEDGTIKEIGKQGATGMNEFISYLKPTITYLAKFWAETERIRAGLGSGWKSIVLGPIGTVLTQLQAIGKEAENLFDKLTGGKGTFEDGKTDDAKKKADAEVKINAEKNQALLADDSKTMEQRVKEDMARTQDALDNRKAEEEFTKEFNDGLAKAWEDELDMLKEAHEKEKQEDEKRLKEKEDSLKKIVDLQKEQADIEQDLIDNQDERNKQAFEQQKEAAEKIAGLTVKEFLEQKKQKELEEKGDPEEAKRFKRLTQLSSTGARLSKKDQEFMKAFNELQGAKGQLAVAQENLKQIEATKQTKTLTSIEKLLSDNLAEQRKLSTAG